MVRKKRNKIPARRIAFLGLMIALSVALITLVHFPIFPAASFLEYDPGDVTMILTTMLCGAPAGLLVTCAAAVIQGLTVSAGSGPYGIIMHVLATGTYVATFSLVVRKSRSLPRMIAGAAAGTAAMTLIMIPANLLITSFYMKAPVAAIWDLMPFIVGFNAIKAGINSVLALVIDGATAPVTKKFQLDS